MSNDFRTLRDFIRVACRTYHIKYRVAERFINWQLQKRKLNRLSIICYINWASGDCLTQKEIAKHLGIVQSVVAYHLQRLYEIWPHLFKFGVRPPTLKYIPSLPADCEQTTELEAQTKHKF